MKYHEFLAEVRALILERAAHSDALNQLFAELVNSADTNASPAIISAQRWVSLRSRHDGLMRSLERWHHELAELGEARNAPTASKSTSSIDSTLPDRESDTPLADVDLDALEAEPHNDHTSPSLPSTHGELSTPGFIWPTGISEGDAAHSALDALAADLGERADPWSSLDIRDYRQTGSPVPLQAEEPRPPTLSTTPSDAQVTRAPSIAKPAVEPPAQVIGPSSSHNEPPEAHNFETLSSVQGLASLAIKLILRTGESMHTGFSTGIGTEYLAIALEHRLEAGQLVHVFFELPSGTQVGANGVVTDVTPPVDGGPPFGALIHYLDLTEEGAAILREVVATY